VSEFKFPTFNCLQKEVEVVDEIGKITDVSDFSMPLVTFNSYKLAAFNYIEKAREFEKLELKDDMNLADNEVPRYFKTVYVPDDKFLLIGGLERESSKTSNRCFMIDNQGKLSAAMDLHVGRQYFAVATDYLKDLIYVIGGFNHENGVLDSFEKFNLRSRKWELSEDTERISKPRINASACKCGDRYIYLFGGLSAEDEFMDRIERYNTQLKIWTVLDVKLPQRMANQFCFSFNPNYIIVLGGLLKKSDFVQTETKKQFELQDKVFVLKTKNNTWKELKPFPFKKKLGQVVYNNHGKFFCFVVEANQELP
jgi:hypothetical protein